MNKINYKIIFSVVTICIISFGFYWLEIRPSLIIKNCSQTASIFTEQDRAFIQLAKQHGYSKEETFNELMKQKYEAYSKNEIETQREVNFQKCLRDHGILE